MRRRLAAAGRRDGALVRRRRTDISPIQVLVHERLDSYHQQVRLMRFRAFLPPTPARPLLGLALRVRRLPPAPSTTATGPLDTGDTRTAHDADRTAGSGRVVRNQHVSDKLPMTFPPKASSLLHV